MKSFTIKIVPKIPNGVSKYEVKIRAADRVTAQNLAIRNIEAHTPCRLHDDERGRT